VINKVQASDFQVINKVLYRALPDMTMAVVINKADWAISFDY
jgi:hypothetical protein